MFTKSGFSLVLMTILLVLVSACSLSHSNMKDKMSWLSATWQSKKNNLLAEETWYWNPEKSQYEAQGFMLFDEDTIYTQHLVFSMEKEKGFLTVETSSDTETKEAFFKLVSYESDSLTFENLFDTFPTYIFYIKDGNSLRTKAMGKKEGQTMIDLRTYNKVEKD
ncbi:MAG: hypothetical protein ACPGEC_04770 [Flavobacteriales bacterium]